MTAPPNRPLYAVLGASGGIGAALCRLLARQGAKLLVGGRRLEPLHRLSEELGATSYRVDGSDFGQVEEFFARGEGELAGAVNCAGSLLLKPAHLTTHDELRQTLDCNLTSAFAVVRSAARALRSKGGSIVLVSSAAASIGLPNHEAIAAAKAGVAGLARAAAATYAPWGIRVNAVAPGLVASPMTRKIVDSSNALDASLRLHPLGRVGQPEEIASLIGWLLGTESGWVTGQVWSIDGGLAGLKAEPRR